MWEGRARVELVATGGYILRMRAVGIKVLKNKLSEYVRLAAAGERILVTDRDRVVAELIPPAEDRPDNVSDARVVEAVRRGWIAQPKMAMGIPPRGAPVMKLDELLRALDEDRADRL